MAHLFNSGRRCVPSFGSLALASVRHAPAIYRKNVALTVREPVGGVGSGAGVAGGGTRKGVLTAATIGL
jgi:hypothetical protein